MLGEHSNSKAMPRPLNPLENKNTQTIPFPGIYYQVKRKISLHKVIKLPSINTYNSQRLERTQRSATYSMMNTPQGTIANREYQSVLKMNEDLPCRMCMSLDSSTQLERQSEGTQTA